jgi:FdhD protein
LSIATNVKVVRIDVAAGEVREQKDVVAVEAPLHVFLGAIHFVSILASPHLLRELVVGHMLSEGVVKSPRAIKEVRFDDEHRCFVTLTKKDPEQLAVHSKPYSRLIVSACGSSSYRSLQELIDQLTLKPLPTTRVAASTVLNCVKQLNTIANTFRSTGGVHVAALYSHKGELLTWAEDVGRHNAVDKVIGARALNDAEFDQCLLALSGRLTGDIALKAARVGIPVAASIAGAVDSGVTVAEQTGMTLVGFVRGHRMNVYAHPERIKV